MELENISINYNGKGQKTNSYIESIARRGLGRNKKYIERLLRRGILQDCEGTPINSDNESFLERLFIIMDSLEDMYPGDWDILCNVKRTGSIALYPCVLFKEFTISNSKNEEMVIKDLLVTLPLKYRVSTGLRIADVYGTRLTLSYEEYKQSYHHSHLDVYTNDDATTYLRTHEFCTGGAEIQQLKVELRHNFSIPTLKLFLITLRSLVEWESIEGTPYRIMRDVTNLTKQIQNIGFNDINDIPTSFYKVDYNELQYSLHNGEILLSNTDELEEDYKKFLIERFKRGSSNYCSHIGYATINDGIKIWNYPSQNSIRRNSGTEETQPLPEFIIHKDLTPYTYFRNTKILLTIEEPVKLTDTEEINYENLDIHPKVLENGKKEIERNIKEAQQKGNTIRRIYSLENRQEHTEQDQVFV